MKKKIEIAIIGTVLLLTGGIIYIAIDGRACPKPVTLNGAVNGMPDFVSYVWPLPETTISSICYFKSRYISPLRIQERGISVELHPASIINLEITPINNKLDQPFRERVNLYVDGNLISNTSRVIFDDGVGIGIMKDGKTYLVPDISREYIFSWTPFLMPGNHKAKIVVNTRSGNPFEYQWNFLVW